MTPRKRALYVTTAGVSLCLLAGICWSAVSTGQSRATDDAYVEADIITVTASSTGTVQTLEVTDNARVHEGAHLLSMDPQDLTLQLDAARASLDVASAQRDDIEGQGGIGGSNRRKAAEASVRLAKARLDQAKLALSKAIVSAPVDGTIARRSVGIGDSVRAGQALFAIVSDRPWITANLKETQLKGIKPGDQADVKIDAFPHLRLKAHVASLQPGTGQVFSLLPAENASGNYVKVVQRVPVKLVFDETPPQGLLPGLSAHVTIHVR